MEREMRQIGIYNDPVSLHFKSGLRKIWRGYTLRTV